MFRVSTDCKPLKSSSRELGNLWVSISIPGNHLHIPASQLQLVLIICGFQICEFSGLLKFVSNPTNQYLGAFTVIHKVVEHLRCSSHMPPVELKLGDALPSHFDFCPINKCLSRALIVPRFSHFCALCW